MSHKPVTWRSCETCRSCETSNVRFSFSGNRPGVSFCDARVKTFVLEVAYVGSDSAHAAVGGPIYLGHLASDDIGLELPAANSYPCALSQDDIMTRG